MNKEVKNFVYKVNSLENRKQFWTEKKQVYFTSMQNAIKMARTARIDIEKYKNTEYQRAFLKATDNLAWAPKHFCSERRLFYRSLYELSIINKEVEELKKYEIVNR